MPLPGQHTEPIAPAPASGARRRFTPWLAMVGVVTFLAGLVFGHDHGVISGARPLVTQDLGLSTFAAEVITSWAPPP